ncbi:MAG: glucose-6-phosphate isomerase family protein [Thermoplasmata archaeon]|nr:glucose-6-phosphate isomerase family protein [Thermoplasmata archaeon]
MTKVKEWPFGITPDNYPEFMGRSSEHTTRKGKDMAGYFQGTPEPEKVIYEVYEAETTGHICMALTILKPGKVGKEYHMTKGHYHEDQEAGEIYVCLKGKGIIIMQTKDGLNGEIELEPGAVASIPPKWAHRTVNVGKKDFVMLAIYPATSGHDYGSIEKSGFLKRVIEEKGKPRIF